MSDRRQELKTPVRPRRFDRRRGLSSLFQRRRISPWPFSFAALFHQFFHLVREGISETEKECSTAEIVIRAIAAHRIPLVI